MSSITMRLREGTTGAVAERDAEFAWFFRNEFEALVRTMYLIVHDREQARDIAQDAFVQLFTRWRRISQYEQPEAWVRRVGIRMAMRSVRRERLRPRLERELDVASLPKPPTGRGRPVLLRGSAGGRGCRHCCVGRSLDEVDRHPWAGVR